MCDKVKILICGDVDGKFKTLFTRVHNVNIKKGPFDFLLCVGNFFGSSRSAWEIFKRESLSVPIPTYVLGPNVEEHVSFYEDINGCELGPNVSYIGKRGLFTGVSGIKLAYVSGSPSSDENNCDYTFSKKDVQAVRDICLRGQSSFRGVDILATSSWPKDVMNLNRREGMREPEGSALLSWLATEIKPRYHFCAQEGLYFERDPYKNLIGPDSSPQHATRFIALAKVGNPEKEKWIYAVNIQPIDKMKASVLYEQTTDETACPYTSGTLLASMSPNQEQQPQYFYDMSSSSDNNRKRHRKENENKSKRRPPPVFDQASCWFCLASPDVEKHLIISIGTEAYLALAKGALVPDHVLILPVEHHQSQACLSEDVLKEIQKFKAALTKFYKTVGKVPVFFERNYRTSHLQIQVVPVNKKVAPILKDEFQERAKAEGFNLNELPQHAKLSQIAPPGTPYFYVELPTGQRLFHKVQKNFPLQFGRDVMAGESILGMPDRADWKDCKTSQAKENEMMQEFRSAFMDFDFTLH